MKLLNKRNNKEENNIFFDYLGPSIDIGFRIGAYSSPRKLILSIEAAHILARYKDILVDQEISFKPTFYLENYIELKGVLGGAQYPIFWLDLLHGRDINDHEDKILNRTQVTPDILQDFAKSFYNEHPSYMFKPFIDNDNGDFAQRPADYDSRYQAIQMEIHRLKNIEMSAPENNLDKNENSGANEVLDDDALNKMIPARQ